MAILLVFSILFLVSTPGLLWVLRRFEINLQKLEFWVLVITGTAWLLVLIFYLLDPNQYFNPVWDAGFTLLPSLAFALDRIGSSYPLAVAALVFFGVLIERTSPQTSSWITPLTATLLLILVADSAYAVALGWTVLEALFLYRFLRNQGELESSTRYILGVLFRLAPPLLLIYISLNYSTDGTAPLISELAPESAPLLLTAGMIGFWGWFQTIGRLPSSTERIRLIHSVHWLPASFGLLLIARAAALAAQLPDFPWGADLAAGLISLLLIAAAFFMPAQILLRVGCLILLIGAYLCQSPLSASYLGILALLSGVALLWEPGSRKAALVRMIAVGVGFLPLPFFPAWIGLAYLDGLGAYFLSAVYGWVFGKLLFKAFQAWKAAEDPSEPVTPLEWTGMGVLLVSQLVIAARLGLFSAGLRFHLIPISTWLSPLLLAASLVFWSRLPGADLAGRLRQEKASRPDFTDSGRALLELSSEAVHLMTRLFEGDGGLLWTLLLGLLIFTLARGGGG